MNIKKITRVVSDWTTSNPAEFRNSNPARLGARSGFGQNSFCRLQNNTPDETITTSTMRSAAIKRQYSSVLPLLHHCVPVLMKFVERQ